MFDRNAIGENMLKMIVKSGMTVEQFAKEIGVNTDTLQRWLDGSRQITVYALYRSARCLRTSMDSLCEGIAEY